MFPATLWSDFVLEGPSNLFWTSADGHTTSLSPPRTTGILNASSQSPLETIRCMSYCFLGLLAGLVYHDTPAPSPWRKRFFLVVLLTGRDCLAAETKRTGVRLGTSPSTASVTASRTVYFTFINRLHIESRIRRFSFLSNRRCWNKQHIPVSSLFLHPCG